MSGSQNRIGFESRVESALRDSCRSGEAITSRLKTKTSILEKLHRQPTRLSGMQDIIGVRVVSQSARKEQNDLLLRIADRWLDSKIYDRRLRPQQGYRAVHLVVTIEARPIEVQLRTRLQHKWAELFEKAADRWGRNIRYGGPVEPPFADKANVIKHLQDFAAHIDIFEQFEHAHGPQAIGDSFATIEKHLDTLREELLEES
jgi:ppGpp synthetase/RelA/SpoT-type nucleotidyltranferase